MSFVFAKNLSVTAGERTLIDDVSFTIQDPGLFVVMGASGSGKSTLLSALSGQLLLDRGQTPRQISGQLDLFGKPLEKWDAVDLGANVGLVFQKPTVFPGSLADNILGTMTLASKDTAHLAASGALTEALSAFGLGHLDPTKPASTLSGGEEHRLAMLRAKVMDPKAILLDEVTAGLDDIVAFDIVQLIRDMASEIPIIMITHDTRLVDWSDRVIVMDAGRIIFDGKLRRDTAHQAPNQVRRLLTASAALNNGPHAAPTGAAPFQVRHPQ